QGDRRMAQALILKGQVAVTGQVGAVMWAPGGGPFATYGVQVKGVGAVPTSWTVTLDGSLDGVNWTTLITHNASDGSTQWEVTGKPCLAYRVNVSAVTLGSASALAIAAVGVP